MNHESHYLWCDLETTGLDPANGRILEFAICLVRDGAEGDMGIVEEYTGVLRLLHAERYGMGEAIDPFVVRMHGSNGLWNECATSDATVADLDDLLCELLAGAAERSIMLAGNSVHFDLAWLRVHCPKASKFLSHRVLDVTTLLSACEVWGKPVERLPAAHRALDDIHQSIEYARLAREQMFGGGK